MLSVGRGIRTLAFAISLAMAFVGCGGAGGVATATPTNGPALATIRYSCVGPPGFLPTLFDQPGTAELEDHPSAAALRKSLKEGRSGLGFLPDSGYWLVNRDEREAQYVTRLPADIETPFGYLTMQVKGTTWEIAGGGDCRPEVLLKDLSPVTWRLRPDRPAPNGSTTELPVLVTESACTGGDPIGDRLAPPSITYTEDAVLIVFAASPHQGMSTCPGIPPTEAMVHLREPLGDRQLLDAGVFPPEDPVALES